MTDPIEGVFGPLVISGWIGEAPTGREEAYLLLTTPDERAPNTMAMVARVLGLGAPGTVTTAPSADTRVEVGADGWATLRVPGGETYARPVDAEWGQIAVDNRRVVLCVGATPLPYEGDPFAYVKEHAERIALGLVPASAGRLPTDPFSR